MRTAIRLAGRAARKARALVRDTSGVTIIEFALSLPLVGMMSFYGLEIAYMSTLSEQTSQIALSIADNASRLGQTDNTAVTPTVAESSIDAILAGAMIQGAGMDFRENGRIILSSLERRADGRQYIHWQRCAGDLHRASSYGNDSTRNGINGPRIDALGEAGHRVTAPSTTQAVMFAEVYYSYRPMLAGLFVDDGEVEFKHEAAFLVRDDRNLSGGGGDGLTGTTVSTC